MALPNGLPQISDLGALLSTLGNDLVDIPLMQPTTTTGSPAAGYFYSSITNRAPMYDLRKDLSVNMGINRISTQQVYQLQNEFGPNGEPVFGAVNDTYGQIRLVGNWGHVSDNRGQRVYPSSFSEYIEFTFYGTGLNLLTAPIFTGNDIRISVNGGAEGSNILSASYSDVIGQRNYSANQIITAVANLSLGLYTVKIRNNTGTVFVISGFEVLNESSSIKVNPGTTWKQGKKLYNPTQHISNYNSGFESGTLGTKGGRVIVYQKADGSIAKAVNPTNVSSAVLNASDHTNEEVIRTYYPREFGAGRTDDFSLIAAATPTHAAFTLDDGTTTLISPNGIIETNQQVRFTGSSNWITFTFVGTGLDILRVDTGNGTTVRYDVRIDGVYHGSHPDDVAATKSRINKICSGLPYGTHVVQLAPNSSPTYYGGALKFIVYGPKKPALPSGATELGNYFLMADFVAGTDTSIRHHDFVSPGVLRKQPAREFVYIGSGWTVDWTYTENNIALRTPTASDSLTYTFVGTGFEAFFRTGSGDASNCSVVLDSLAMTAANFPSATITYSGPTGSSYSGNTIDLLGNTGGFRLSIKNLTFGKHTVTVTRNGAGTEPMVFYALDIITPIHSPKDNGPFVVQNTLAIGSQGISDSRKLATQINRKSRSQAMGVSSGPSVTTAAYTLTPTPDLSTIIKTTTGRIRVDYSAVAQIASAGEAVMFWIVVDGVVVSRASQSGSPTAGSQQNNAGMCFLDVSPGEHKVDIYWSATAAVSRTANNETRMVVVEEVD